MLRNIWLCIIAAASISSSNAEEAQVRGAVSAISYGGKGRAEAMLGASKEVTENLDARMIAGYQATEYETGDPRLLIGLLDMHPVGKSVGVRVGRVEHVQGYWTQQYNWIPARDFNMPPQGGYRDQLRYAFGSGDGVQLYGQKTVGDFSLAADLSWVRYNQYPPADLNKSYYKWGSYDRLDSRSTNMRVRGISLQGEYEPTGTSLRYDRHDLTWFQWNTKTAEGFPLPFLDAKQGITTHLLGVKQRVTDDLDVIADWSWYTNFVDGLPKYTGPKPKAASLVVRWQATEKLRLSAGAGAFYGDMTRKYIARGRDDVGSEAFQEDLMVAARYTEGDWIFMADLHRLSGTAALPQRYAQDHPKAHTLLIFSVTRTF